MLSLDDALGRFDEVVAKCIVRIAQCSRRGQAPLELSIASSGLLPVPPPNLSLTPSG